MFWSFSQNSQKRTKLLFWVCVKKKKILKLHKCFLLYLLHLNALVVVVKLSTIFCIIFYVFPHIDKRWLERRQLCFQFSAALISMLHNCHIIFLCIWIPCLSCLKLEYCYKLIVFYLIYGFHEVHWELHRILLELICFKDLIIYSQQSK